MTNTATTFDPLEWGHGPHRFEMFLEPTCPFSCRALGKIDAFLEAAGAERVTVKIRLQSQPWHMFSPVIVRAILAASSLPEGRAAARRVLEAVAAHREEFEFEHHATGPNREATPNQILARIETYSGVAVTEAFDRPELEAAVKWQAKYARQNGIHVSPTFMVDGLVTGLGSGDPVEKWAEALK